MHTNGIEISVHVYEAAKTSDFCHSRLIVLSAAVSLIPLATTRLRILITTS